MNKAKYLELDQRDSELIKDLQIQMTQRTIKYLEANAEFAIGDRVKIHTDEGRHYVAFVRRRVVIEGDIIYKFYQCKKDGKISQRQFRLQFTEDIINIEKFSE